MDLHINIFYFLKVSENFVENLKLQELFLWENILVKA